MRTKKSIINMVVSFTSQIIFIALGFISRRVLIYSVGVEYLGINGLMTNILTVFSLAESGIGTVICFNLYEPLAKKNYEKVKSLMLLYKKSYHLLALFTLIVGLLFIPFLPMFLKGNTVSDVYLIYGLYLFSSAASYLFSYKATLNNADQNKYLTTIANTITQILVLILKVLILYFTENYILFLTIDIFSTILKNIIFSYIVDKRYPFLKDKNVQKLDKDTESKIFSNIKALFINKIGYIISQCSDNLVISSLISVTSLGLYSNYTTLVSFVSGFVTLFTGSLNASLGNLIALEDSNKVYSVYKKINLINTFLYTISAVCLLHLVEPFIIWWLGDCSFVMSKSVLIVTILNFYFRGINLSIDMVKNASGLFKQDRYISILEAITNLIISILLAPKHGITGVMIGTLFSFLVFSFWIKPCIVYKYIFVTKKITNYWINYGKKLLIFVICFYLCQVISNYIILIFENHFLAMVIQGLIYVCICLFILVVTHFYTNEFKELFEKVKMLLNKQKSG